MDYKFWLILAVNLIGVGFAAVQTRIMKQQIASLPSPRSTKRAAVERALVRRLYTPVFVMAGLVLLSWLPYVLARRPPEVLPNMVFAWGGYDKGCSVEADTSPIAKLKDKYRLFLVCTISDPTVDSLEDDRIAISKPFNITGGPERMVIVYDPQSSIAKIALPGVTQSNQTLIILPRDQDGSRIRRLSDVSKEGGQILIPGSRLPK